MVLGVPSQILKYSKSDHNFTSTEYVNPCADSWRFIERSVKVSNIKIQKIFD